MTIIRGRGRERRRGEGEGEGEKREKERNGGEARGVIGIACVNASGRGAAPFDWCARRALIEAKLRNVD